MVNFHSYVILPEGIPYIPTKAEQIIILHSQNSWKWPWAKVHYMWEAQWHKRLPFRGCLKYHPYLYPFMAILAMVHEIGCNPMHIHMHTCADKYAPMTCEDVSGDVQHMELKPTPWKFTINMSKIWRCHKSRGYPPINWFQWDFRL